jgi:hypothetical protein
VTDRVARYTVRIVVLLALWSAITGEIAARVVLSHGSGTYFALLVFLPLLVAPGVLAWKWPRPMYVALWSALGWLSTIVWSIAGTPYRYERELDHWKYVAMPVWIAIALVLFVAPIVAMLMVKQREVPAERELLAQRLRRIVVLAIGLATVVIVTSFAMGGGEAFVVATFAMLLVAPAAFVQRMPSKPVALLWTAWCVPFALLGILIKLELGVIVQWGPKVVVGGLGSIFVLLLVGLPLACMTAIGPFFGTSARASYRSRR